MHTKLIIKISILLSLILLSGCGGGGSSSAPADKATPQPTNRIITGKVVDGLIKEATVCLDINKNNLCDTNEPTTTSDIKGEFSLDIGISSGEYIIISIGGIDTATNQHFDALLKETVTVSTNNTITSQDTILTPLTTIATEVYENEKNNNSTYTHAKAKQQIANNLGLTLEQISADPIQDKIVFAKTQKIIQAIKILSVSIQKDTSSRTVNQDVFSHVLKQVAKTINEDSLSNDINISKVVKNLEAQEYKDTAIIIDDNIEEFVQKYVNDVEDKIEATTSNSDLTSVQNGLETYVSQITTTIKTAVTPTTLSNELENTLSDLKSKDTETIILQSKSKNSTALRSVVVSRGDTATNSFVTSTCGTLGGIAVYTGIDSNSNNILDESEQNPTPQVVCNGAVGATGEAGGSSSDVSMLQLQSGDTNCPNGGISLSIGTQTSYICNGLTSAQTPAENRSFTSTGTIKGNVTLTNIYTRDLRSIRKMRSMNGGLWLTPAKVQAAIDADIEAQKVNSTTPIPTPIVEPIKVDINTTDNSYAIPEVPSGEYSLIYVDTDNNEGTKIDDIVVEPGETEVQDITEVKPNGTVSFKVASLSGTNLSNAIIRLNELDKNTTTEPDGTAGFNELPEGTYSLTVYSTGYVSKYKTFTITSGQTTDLQTIEMNSQKGKLVGSVTANIVDDLANIIVYAKAADSSIYTTLTDNNGNYTFPSLPVGSGYSIIATAHDFESSKVDNIDILENEKTNANNINITKAISTKGSISGFARFGEKVDLNHAGIIVSIEGTDQEAITSRDGSFILNNVESTNVTLNFTDSNHLTQTQTVNVIAGANVFVDDITLVQQVLKGQISKGSGVTDHSGIAINIVGRGLYATTDSDGNFTIVGVPSYDMAVEYSVDGFKTKVLLWNMKDNGSVIPLETMESAKISGASVTINSNDISTNNQTVNLTIDAASAVKMLISDNINFTNAGDVVDFARSYTYTLPSGDGVKTVYVKLYDAALSESTKVLVSDTIELDSIAPAISKVNLSSGTNVTNSINIKLYPQYIEENGIKYIKIYKDNTYVTYPYDENGIDWVLPSTTNQNIKIKLIDFSGNESSEFSQNIVFDTTAPILSSATAIGSAITNSNVLVGINSIDDYKIVEISDNEYFSNKQTFTKDQDANFVFSDNLDDGAKTLYIRIQDTAGNYSDVKNVSVTLDRTIPTKPIIGNESNTITNLASYEIFLSMVSVDTNFDYYEIRVNDGGWSKESTVSTTTNFTYNLNDSASNKLQIRAVDKAGNNSDISYIYITHDKNALNTSASPISGFYNTDVTTRLTSVGEDAIYYTIDGTTPTINSSIYNANSPIAFTSEGTHTIKYFAVNSQGQKETIKTTVYNIDKTSPIISFENTPSTSNKDVDLNLSVSDNSLVALRYEITTDGSEPVKPNSSSNVSYSSIPLTNEAVIVKVKVIGIDEAGNSSNEISTQLRVDKTAPNIDSITQSGTFSALTGKMISIGAIDTQDQQPKIYYTLDGTTPTKNSTLYEADFNLTTVGIYELKAITIDDLNNISDVVNKTYKMSTIYDSSNNIITADTNWTKSMSPYSIESDIHITSGATLTIEAGVEVVLNYGDGIMVDDGTLIAIGTQNEKIRFVGGTDYRYNKGIYFYDASIDATFNDDGSYLSGSTIQHAHIENIYHTALHAHTSSPYFENITMQNVEYGLNLYRSNLKAKNIDINSTKQDAIIAAGGAYTSNLENITIKNYGSNAIESHDSGTVVNITKSDIEYVDGKTMFWTRYSGTIDATENYYHTYNLTLLDTLVVNNGTSLVYEPMLSGPINTADFDGDGILDIDDTDDDNDKYTDIDEANAHTSQFLNSGVGLPADNDGDFISDITDTDDDNDGFKDIDELAVGADPFDDSSTFEVVNAQEIALNTTLPINENVDTLLLKGNIIIPIGKTLTIRAGTKVIMGGNYSFQIHGSIKFLGEPNNRITVTPKLPSNQWNNNHFDGFIFYDDSTALITDENNNYISGSLIKNTDIKYAGSVIASIYKTTATKTSGFVYLDGSSISHSKYDAIHVQNVSDFVLKDTNITNTGTTSGHEAIFANNITNLVAKNISVSNTAGEVFEIYSSKLDISNSNFIDNTNNTVVWARATDINSTNNNFLNDKAAYHLESNDILISTNDTMDEMKPYSNYNAPIEIRGNSKATIQSLNMKRSNRYGIFASTSNTIKISDSNISNCSESAYYNESNGFSDIKSSQFINSKEGIRLRSTYFAKAEDNNISNNAQSGLILDAMVSGGYMIFRQNTISNNQDYGIRTNTKEDIVFNTITANHNGGIYLDGDSAIPKLSYNNIYANNTQDNGDNTKYDIRNERTLDLTIANNYHGTLNNISLSNFNYDKLDKADKGRIYFDSYLDTPLNIKTKTSKDTDGDGVMDIYDSDDDNDGVIDRIETDNNNGQRNAFIVDNDQNISIIDTDRDGILDSNVTDINGTDISDTDDDNDGISDIDEATYGTNPKLADTDGDGIDDLTEINEGMNPLVKDGIGGVLYDDVVISSDTYVKDLVIPNGITLSSDNGSKIFALSTITLKGGEIKNIFIDGMGIDKDYAAVTIKTATTATNLDIQNANIGIQADATLKLYDSHIENVVTAIQLKNSDLTVENSNFKNGENGVLRNITENVNSTINISKSEFSDFTSYGIYLYSYRGSITLNTDNSLFRNNNKAVYLQGNYSNNGYAYGNIKNSTFDSNTYAFNRYTSSSRYGKTTIKDSVFTNNNVALRNVAEHTNNVYYSNNSGNGTSTGEQTLTVNPYKAAYLGYTTASASISDGNTTITDSSMNFDTNELQGSYIQADARSGIKYEILSNTNNTIKIKGEIPSTSRDENTSYTIKDYHIKAGSLANTASSTSGIVGAFDNTNDPYWSYLIYTDDNATTSGDAISNQIWKGTVTLSGSVNFVNTAHLRIERGTKVIFAENNASQTLTVNAGGIQAFYDKNSFITFTSSDDTNTSKNQWGGIVLNGYSNLTNIKIQNASTAIENNAFLIATNLDIQNANIGIQADATLKLYDSHIENVVTAIQLKNSDLTVENSNFKNGENGVLRNISENVNSTINISKSELSDFTSYGIYLYSYRGSITLNTDNSLFRNNNNAVYLQGNYSNNGYAYGNIKNSTFDSNTYAFNRYTSSSRYGKTTIKDSVFTNNNVALRNVAEHTNNVYYSNNSGNGTSTGEQTLTTNPYKAAYLGYTTASASISDGNTTITDSSMNFDTNELQGSYIQADARSGIKYEILSNTNNTIKIKGEIPSTSRDENTSYTIKDYHIKAGSLANTASSTSGIVGAFDNTNDPYWSYLIYTDDNATTSGDAISNQIWKGTVTLSGSVNFVNTAHLRIERGTKVIFAENNASQTLTVNAGGIQAFYDKNSFITFTSSDDTNTSKNQWGGIVLNGYSNLTNIKIQNASTAIENNAFLIATNLDIQNANIGIQADATLKLYDSHIENVVTAIQLKNSDLTVENSNFKNGENGVLRNISENVNSTINISKSELSDFTSYGIYLYSYRGSITLNTDNSLFRNNNNAVYLQGNYSNNGYAYGNIKNSTFDSNTYAFNRYTSSSRHGKTTIKDSVFTNNNVALRNVAEHTNNVYYSNNSGNGTSTGEQTLTTNPYKAAYLGYTTASASISDGNTTITDSSMNFDTNELQGSYIQADARSGIKYEILSNTNNTIKIKGEIPSTSRDENTSYTIKDYHIKAGSLANTASSTSGIVGAFDNTNDPYWSYLIYTDDNATTSGDAISNQIWKGTVTLSGSVNFVNTAHLRIERGTKVIFAENNASQTLTVNAGGIQAFYDKNSFITFTSSDDTNTSKNQWGGIVLNGYSNLTNIKIQNASTAIENNAFLIATNLDIQNANIGIQADATLKLYDSHIENVVTAIQLKNSDLTVENSNFKNGENGVLRNISENVNSTINISKSELSDFTSYGIYLYSYRGSITLNTDNSLFRNNNNAVYLQGNYSNNGYAYGNIKNSTFDSNTYAFNRYTSSSRYGKTTIKDSVFTNNNVALRNVAEHTNNVYYSNNSGNGTSTGEQNTGNPYEDLFIGNLHIKDGHEAKTASSIDGEVGVFGGENPATLSWITYGDPSITLDQNRTKFDDLTSNQWWDGNTTLTGDLVIPTGKILKLSANANLLFPIGNKLVVQGTLMLESEKGSEVVFNSSSENPNSQSWDGLKIQSTGATYKHIIVKNAQNGIDTTGSNGVTLSNIQVIDSNSTAIIATGKVTIEDSSIWGTKNETGSTSIGIKITGDATIRRNVIANTDNAISISGLTTENIDINHNIIASNNIGIHTYYNTSSNYPRAKINYNTIDDSTSYGISMNNNGNNVKYNIITNSGTSAINASNNYDTSVNALTNNNAAIYTGGIAESTTSLYTDLLGDPDYTDVTNSITKNNIGYGIYGDILNSVDYKTNEAIFDTYTPYSSKMGAYNLITYADTNTTRYRTDTQRGHDDSFVNNNMSVSGIIKTALPNMIVNIDTINLDNTTTPDISIEQAGYSQNYSFRIGTSNTITDGNHTIEINAVDEDDSNINNTINYGVFNLDNTGATLTLNDFINNSQISQNTKVHLNIEDNLIGARKYEYSKDGGVTWNHGERNIYMVSGGEEDGNTAELSFDNNNTADGNYGFNLVEINTSNFSYISNTAQTFAATNVDALTTYLNGLNNGTMIAFVVKQNARDTNTNRHNNLISALRNFGFEGNFNTNDSIAFIGEKGLKKIHAITKIVSSTNGYATIDLSEEYGVYNSAITLDTSCYNDDGAGNCNVKVRGIDLLGNVGEVFDINYSVSE
jgi:hypothetical protein